MPAPPDPAAEPRQRWRLVVACDHGTDRPQRDVTATWTAALQAAGLPLAGSEGQRGRARIAFGAPLPVGMAAERELIDIVLVDRWPRWRLREALTPHVPAGWRLIDAHDVWLGGPPLAGRVAGADYRIELEDVEDIDALRRAATQVDEAERIPRKRPKGGTLIDYDLRPLLVAVAVDPGPPPVIRTRTRFDPELGTGRPEEVVAAMADRLGTALETRAIIRERLLLIEDLA